MARRRIGGAGGGSDPARGGAGRVLVAAAAAVAVATGGGAAIGGVTGSTAGGAESALVRDLGANKTAARKSAQRGDVTGAWRRMGMRSLKRRAERYAECVTHSTGQLREFLVRTPCRRLDRVLFLLTDGAGNTAAVAVSWVDMRGGGAARRLLELSDTDGTGHVLALGDVVALTGRHYSSRLVRSVAVAAEAEPVSGRFDDEVLDAVAEVAVWLPHG